MSAMTLGNDSYGTSRTSQKGPVLRNLLVDGKIVLSPGEEAGTLWAKYSLAPAVLLRAAGTSGRGDWI